MRLWENTSPSSSRSVPARSTSPVPVQDRRTVTPRALVQGLKAKAANIRQDRTMRGDGAVRPLTLSTRDTR